MGVSEGEGGNGGYVGHHDLMNSTYVGSVMLF